MQVGISEFLTKVSKLSRSREKIRALKANDSYPLRLILQAGYDPDVKWLLPEGIPPFTKNDAIDMEWSLIKNIDKLRFFIANQGHDHLHPSKRELIFIQFLESITKEDADLVLLMKDKKPITGITLRMVVSAFPGLIPSVSEEDFKTKSEEDEEEKAPKTKEGETPDEAVSRD